MTRVEELPDDFDEALDLSGPPKFDADDDAVFEEMYYNRFAKKGPDEPESNPKSFEEVMLEFSKTPLFMNDLNEVANAGGENAGLDAIRALQYEGTKGDIAQGFKEQGNEMVKAQMWGDAKEFYTKAIAVLTDKSDDKWEKGDDAELEAKREKELEEQCFTNRALCHLELKNFRSTTIDCASALRLNPSNIKAHYRSALALLALNKTTDASDVCFRGLKLDPGNTALKKLNETVQARQQVEDLKARKRAIEEYKTEKKKFMLATALKVRNITLRGSPQAPDLEDAEIHLSPDPMDPKSMLVFPVVFLYPLHAQSDFVKQFGEKDSIIDHLSYIFPLPWDAKQEYRIDSVECFMDTTSGGMAKIGKRLSMLQALTTGRVEIVDGLVKIHVVPTSLTGKWTEEMKKRKAGV